VMVWTRFKILMQIEHGTEPSWLKEEPIL
jgi:hypothetical protein